MLDTIIFDIEIRIGKYLNLTRTFFSKMLDTNQVWAPLGRYFDKADNTSYVNFKGFFI